MTVPVSSTVVVTHAMPSASSDTVSLSPPGPVNVTEPDGLPTPKETGATVTQSVTVSPHTDGSGSTETPTVTGAWLTTCSVRGEFDASKCASPE
ncbi:hypothetical protein EES37_25965 [Streptomyces sp. ADI91-18]|nr:hypothetical protein EES37_25965 [Streptomyces sp. ADI91-18]